MNFPLTRFLGFLVIPLFLAACGGGDTKVCGGQVENFRASYPTTSLKRGVATTVTPNFSPESCRGDATFTMVSGSVPTGMSFASNGVISGTPSTTGTFSFGYTMSVKNYSGTTLDPNVSLTVIP